MEVTPMKLIAKATQAVPAVKYAIGVAGIGALLSIIAGYELDYRVAVFGTMLMFAFMFLLVLFSSFSQLPESQHHIPSLFMAWVFVVIISASTFLLATSFFFAWPNSIERYFKTNPDNNLTQSVPIAITQSEEADLQNKLFNININTGAKLEKIRVLGRRDYYSKEDLFSEGTYYLYIEDVYPPDGLIPYVKENDWLLPLSYITSIDVKDGSTKFNIFEKERIDFETLTYDSKRTELDANFYGEKNNHIIIDYVNAQMGEDIYTVSVDDEVIRKYLHGWQYGFATNYHGVCSNTETGKADILFSEGEITASGLFAYGILQLYAIQGGDNNDVKYTKLGNYNFRDEDIMLCGQKDACVCTWPITLRNIDLLWTTLLSQLPHYGESTGAVVASLMPVITAQDKYPTIVTVESLASNDEWLVIAASERIRNRNIILTYRRHDGVWNVVSENEFPYTVGSYSNEKVSSGWIEKHLKATSKESHKIKGNYLFNWRKDGFSLLNMATGTHTNYNDYLQLDNLIDQETNREYVYNYEDLENLITINNN